MNKEDESIAALVRSQSAALSQTSGTSLVRRGMQDLLAKADADQWYQRGLSLCLWDDPANLIQPEAVECFRRGLQSDPNHVALQFYLGVAYLEGGAMPKDYAQAAIWWRKSADQGNAVAQQALGVLYYRGEGVPKDYAEAALWYRQAADQGNAEAQYCIAEAYATGKGVPQDFEHAAVWYRKAAKQGHGRAQRALDDLLRKMPDTKHESMRPSR